MTTQVRHTAAHLNALNGLINARRHICKSMENWLEKQQQQQPDYAEKWHSADSITSISIQLLKHFMHCCTPHFELITSSLSPASGASFQFAANWEKVPVLPLRAAIWALTTIINENFFIFLSLLFISLLCFARF